MRDKVLRQAKVTLRDWFAGQDDAYLTRVVDECRAGVFGYNDACHCLRGLCAGGYFGRIALTYSARNAEDALLVIGDPADPHCRFPGRALRLWREEMRRKRVLPIVLAEMNRRRLRVVDPQPETAGVCCTAEAEGGRA